MKSFWGFYDNGIYRVGCNGATVYIYDSHNKEIAKFKDFPDAYTAEFMPNKNIIAVKSTAGYIGFYDLDKLTLMKKHIITKIGAQDECFSFSPDGRFFYNIEKPISSFETQLGIYETETFDKVNTLFSERKDLSLCQIEFDESSDNCYVLGFMRNETEKTFVHGFIGLLNVSDANIADIKILADEQYKYAYAYKSWEIYGFTPKSRQWNYKLKNLETITPISLKDIYNSI